MNMFLSVDVHISCLTDLIKKISNTSYKTCLRTFFKSTFDVTLCRRAASRKVSMASDDFPSVITKTTFCARGRAPFVTANTTSRTKRRASPVYVDPPCCLGNDVRTTFTKQ